jgi:hypothetical protein
MAVRLALNACVKQLILGHHAPEDNDVAIQRKLEHAWRLSESHDLEVIIPEEDDIIEVS